MDVERLQGQVVALVRLYVTQRARIAALEKRLAALERRIAAIEALIEAAPNDPVPVIDWQKGSQLPT